MNGRVFICHHMPPARVISTSLFATIRSGVSDDPATGLIGDLSGRNIAEPNRHSEMRHQFHVLHERAAGLDYVGFEHHRRIFFLEPVSAPYLYRIDPSLLAIARQFYSSQHLVTLAVDEAVFQSCLDLRITHDEAMKALVDRLMRDHDVMTQRPFAIPIDDDWRANHPAAEWDVLVDVVRRSGFFRQSFDLIDFSLGHVRFCSMYIMRLQIFRDYMDFWMECMAQLERLIDGCERHLGYFSERLLNFFLYGRRMQDASIRIGCLPYVTHRP